VTVLADYPQVAAGKVRELYAVGDDLLLFVASDRISAFDHVLETHIPDKGRVLTAMSVFWFELLADEIGNHLVSADDPRIPDEVRGRALLVRKLRMLPVEAVARGYLTGSGLIDYDRTGEVCGVALPPGLFESSKLPEPIFTPATKAAIGEHDENVTYEDVAAQIGEEAASGVRAATLRVYLRAAEHAESRGLILADTKFEFGLDAAGELVLADEALTPDSSRYWPLAGYEPGRTQPSFDKQFVRNWLLAPEARWDRHGTLPPPPLPEHVVEATRQRYIEAYERITGRAFADWP
jgi:phosphoribosylaminoimidazole-succinocarboxamide synthase